MCVICLKEPGVEMPSENTIRKMFNTNSHGAGYAIQGDIRGDGETRVIFRKGFMDVKSFLDSIKEMGDLTEYRVAMHFRIKTSGETDAPTTHPFLLSDRLEDVRKTSGEGPVVFHNGVFAGLGGKADPITSDTQDFVMGVASKYLNKAEIPSPLDQAIVQEIVGTSRVLILYESSYMPYLKIGTWHKHEDGCLYSNLAWDTPIVSYSRGYSTASSYDYKYKNTDSYGCNHSNTAWPSNSTKWIRCNTKERLDQIVKCMTFTGKVDKETGGKIYEYGSYTGPTKWYIFEDTLDIVHEDMLKDYLDWYQEEYLADYYASLVDENQTTVEFMDENDLEAFIKQTTQVSGNSEFIRKDAAKRVWYIDQIDLVAYTYEGLKIYFKTGELGHAVNNIRKFGTANTLVLNDIKAAADEEDKRSKTKAKVVKSKKGEVKEAKEKKEEKKEEMPRLEGTA